MLSEEDDDEVKPLFIPLTLSKPRPQIRYNETDPENKMFKDIVRDPERERKVKSAYLRDFESLP